MFRTCCKSLVLAVTLLSGIAAEAATFEYRIARAKQLTSAAPISPGGTDVSVGNPAPPGGTAPAAGSPSGGTALPPPTGTPAIEPSASSLNFGRTATNSQPVTRQILVTNTGTATLVFSTAPYLTGSSAFGMGLSNCAQSLAPGASCSVEVTYYPTTVGVDNASLYFRSNAPALEVPVQGEGYNPVKLQRVEFTFVNTEWYKVSMAHHLTVDDASPDPWLVTWEVLDPLPPGMSFSERGVISGTPIEGNINFYVVRIRATYRGNSAVEEIGMYVGDCDQFNMCYETQPDPNPNDEPISTTPVKNGDA